MPSGNGTGAVTGDLDRQHHPHRKGIFANGIVAYQSGGCSAVDGDLDPASITTAGNGTRTGFLPFTGTGAVTVTSTGNITTAGNSAYGIFAHSGGTGAIAVTSAGNITTAGGNGYGINASGGGAVTVTSTGNITTTGTQGAGIRVCHRCQ